MKKYLLTLIAIGLNAGVACAGSLTGAETRVNQPDQVAEEINRLLAGHEQVLKTALAREGELAALPEWKVVASFQSKLAAIRQNLAAGNLAAAYELVSSWLLANQRRQVETEIVAAMPFLVIGPFGDEPIASLYEPDGWRRAGAAFGTPFLGEFDTLPRPLRRQWHYLPKAFVLDASRTFPGPAGNSLGWRKSWQIGAAGLDFGSFSNSWAVVYAWSQVYCPEVRGAGLEVTAEVPSLFMWLNGALVVLRNGAETYKYGTNNVPEVTPCAPPAVVPSLTFSQGGLGLNKGWNTLLIKTLHRRGARFTMRWMHFPAQPARPMEDLRYRWPEPAEDKK